MRRWLLYPAGAYLLFWPFFSTYVNIGASGVGLVREPTILGRWLLIWGFFLFVLASWLSSLRRDRRGWRMSATGDASEPAGIERAVSLGLRRYDRLPRVVYLQQLLVQPADASSTCLLRWLLPLARCCWRCWRVLVGWGVLALCLPLLGLAFVLLWRRGRAADAGSVFAALLTVTGLAILAGTQVVYLKDFLHGSDWYRMNTLFKFFSQVWVIWGVAAAIATAASARATSVARQGAGRSQRRPGLALCVGRRLSLRCFSPAWPIRSSARRRASINA